MKAIKNNQKQEYGDFQTPIELAVEVCEYLKSQSVQPRSIIEPTCGVGNFIRAGLKTFDAQVEYFGNEINGVYLDAFREQIRSFNDINIKLRHADFFQVNWQKQFQDMPQPLLVIGNPPWITNSDLGCINGTNLPLKNNFQDLNGFEALTGKSNFDISEWMLLHLLYLLQDHDAILAMLCKTSVARKVLRHVWRKDYRIKQFDIYLIDAKRYFNIAVDACLLIGKTQGGSIVKRCNVYQDVSKKNLVSTIGIYNNDLLSDIEGYNQLKDLAGVEYYKWRSGIKHDCAQVMEFVLGGEFRRNGLGEVCDLEDEYLYPLFKSSEVAKNEVAEVKRLVLLPQKNMGDDTSIIKERAPKTWDYLLRHSDRLDRRKSSIYSGRPRFSIFGIGDYSFSAWKVAISGLYKKIRFSVIGSFSDKPAMVDDTCYFIACHSKAEAYFIAELLNSDAARMFLSSFIFWDSKRPITMEILRRIDLAVLAKDLGKEELFCCYKDVQAIKPSQGKQAMLF